MFIQQMYVNKIVIVGGGSAGWMSASALIKAYPEIDISVIESPNIPIVGVGESTVFEFKYWLDFLGIDYIEFMKNTDATFKLGGSFKDFREKESPEYLEPFGGPDFENLKYASFDNPSYRDWYIYRLLYKKSTNEDFSLFYYPQSHLIKHGTIFMEQDHKMVTFNPNEHIAFHMDANKFAPWLAESYAKPRGVNHIQKTINEVVVEDDNVKNLILDDGEIITADLFIDCSGFKSLLLGQALKQNFISTKNLLPNDSAWVGQVPYTNKDIEILNHTSIWGMPSGWTWYAPLWSRAGSGYVYDSDFIDDESALKEFKQHLDSKKMPVYDPNRSDKMKFRKIDIKNGYYEKAWTNNVCGMGLSFGFIEPLATTGLLSIHQSLFMLIKALARKKITQWEIDEYNHNISAMTKDFLHFVLSRYILSQRDDTPYWKNITSKSYDPEIREKLKNEDGYGALIRNSMGLLPITESDLHGNVWKKNVRPGANYMQELDEFILSREEKIKYWDTKAASSVSHYEYLKENIYNEN